MGLNEEFDDRHIQTEAEQQPYIPYEYQTENNDSWAGALPVKQGLYDPSYEKDACGVGFACHIKGKPSHKIVSDARNLLCNMTHRGAVGSDARDGDGAGVMTSIPHRFFIKNFEKEEDIKLPPLGQYAVGNLFFKPDEETLQESKRQLEDVAESLGLRVLGWRRPPVDSTLLGPAAKSREPIIAQPFVVLASAYGTGNAPEMTDPEKFDERLFERQLYILRKRATQSIGLHNWFYLCSLSNKNIVYKGQLAPVQVYSYYHDLVNADYEAHFALVHSRFSTNTFPSWDRAQPLRWAAHNGEINTLRGNKNWMRAREGVMQSDIFKEELEQMYPVVEDGGSDSAAFDNVLELLTINGVLSLPEAVMLMVPEAWQGNQHMDPKKAAFYEWAACQMEPWDGPALFTFADGRYCGANLDRNGLRPCRFYVMDDDRIICASEVGTIPVEPETVIQKGRLQPGRMLLVDTQAGRIIDDKELKEAVSSRYDFRAWLDSELITLPKVVEIMEQALDLAPKLDDKAIQADPLLLSYGYTHEQVSLLLAPMAADEKEALGSMGNDAPLACLTQDPRLLYDYFRQLFAQVTNPPIDPIRESIVMSLECYVGPQGNLLEMDASQCGRLLLPSPILSIEEFNAVKNMSNKYSEWTVKTIDLTFPKNQGIQGYIKHLDEICNEASAAIESRDRVIVLSDRNTSADRVPVSAVLASAMVHHHLVSNKWRSMVALVIETAEAREVHHMCVLLGYGADAINPYLAMECILKLNREGLIKKKTTNETLIRNYKHSCDGGILKVMSKMGISTLASYKGAQIFEILGLDETVVERCFRGTASRIQGMTFELIAEEAFRFHERGFPTRETILPSGLPESGEYHWRDGGEPHVNDPTSIANIQDAVRTKNDKSYEAYSRSEYEQIKNCTLRGLLDFKFEDCTPVPIDQVEPWTDIVRRFCTGAMSYGSISMESHSTLAVAMNRLGGKSNTGEGGEDPERSQRMPNGDTMRSAIKQVASGRFGVTSAYLADSDELQIKMAQGAKPGEGGELPGHKVSKSIARTRHSTPGVGLISPPPHHDIYSIEDLKQLIYDLKCSSPRSRVSVKLVSEVGVGIVASGVAKAKADHILISGHDGGTGASRWTGIKYAGLPWELGLAETHQTLVLNDLRGRVVVQTDGQLKTGRDVALACLLGAEEWGFATAPLIAMGCVFMRKCLEISTMVRTSQGPKPISAINIGDTLYDPNDNPVLCLAVAPAQQGRLKEIHYKEFDSRRNVSFKCTPDHILPLRTFGTRPSASKTSVTWFTYCDRHSLERQADRLRFEDLVDTIYRDLMDSHEVEIPGQAAAHGYVDTILTRHYHQGQDDRYSNKIVEVLSRLANQELENNPDLVREAMHDAVDLYFEQPPNLVDDAEYYDDAPTIDLGPDFVALRDATLASTTAGSTYRRTPSLEQPDSQSSRQSQQTQRDSQQSRGVSQGSGGISRQVSLNTQASSSSFMDSSAISLSEEAIQRFNRVKASINRKPCLCGGIRKIYRQFASEEQALLVQSLLLSQHAHMVDPYVVRDGDEINVSVETFEGFCNKEAKRMHFKLHRAPLAFVPAPSGQDQVTDEALPIDPYFLGLWLGDGGAEGPFIYGSDHETRVWLSSYVDRLNNGRPAGTRPLKLREYRTQQASDSLRNSHYMARVDVFRWAITSEIHATGQPWSPIRDGLRNLGLLNNKSAGIPDCYLQASKQARLAVLAGLIDSDGCYVKSHNTYRFIQHGEGHRKIVEDAKTLALSCGISVTSVDTSTPLNQWNNRHGTSVQYVIYLGKGSNEFQNHLLIPRKRMNPAKTFYTHDARPFTVSDVEDGQYRGIQVSGGLFQLQNRLITHNCHLNTCPVGIATQDPELRKKFTGTPEHVINFFYYVANELRAIMAQLGFRTINEMVGHVEVLKMRDDLRTNKTANIDLSLLLTPAHKLRPGVATFNVRKQDHKLHVRLDNKLISESELTLDKGLPSRIECDIVNTDRAMGTSLSYHISKRYGEAGLPMDTVHVNIKGSAGQSFGAFLAPGVTLELEGDANDYVGKGLSGGRLIIYPPRSAVFKSEENILIGNTCLYGATTGTCFFRGVAAERFAVRNSGATAVVEGVGDHGCEYMTGGRVLVLGSTGRNFAAGMSGGIAYILDVHGDFHSKLNGEMVEASGLEDPAEIAFVRGLVEDHHHYTGSERAARILVDFNRALPRFVKVLPVDYKRVLEEEAAKAAEAKRAEYNLPAVSGVQHKKSEKVAKLQDLEEAVGDNAAEKKRALVLDKTRGFKMYKRRQEKYRPVNSRLKDWAELSSRLDEDELKYQSARCMDCGVPFCQSETGCPISNIIPKWNELVFQCLAPETLVRTMDGNKAVRDISIGDKLFDHNDMPVLCTGVGDIKPSSTMKTITYKEWNSKVDVSFDCTSDHIMSLASYGVAPTIKLGCVVVWYTRCDRTELVEEIKDLKWDEIMHRAYSGASDEYGRRPTDAEAHTYIDSLVDKWSATPLDADNVLFPVFEQFKGTISVHDADDIEDDSLEPLFRAALHEYIDEYLEHLVPEQEEVPDDEDDLEIDLDASRPRKFRALSRLPSSTHPSDPSYRQTTAVPSSPPAQQAQESQNSGNSGNSQQAQEGQVSAGSSFADTANMVRDEDHMEKFAAVRDAIAPKCQHASAPCKGFRKYQVRFKNEEQARLALDLLRGDHYRVVDPFAVQNGDIWTMKLEEYEISCAALVAPTNRKLKLYRAPLRFVPAPVRTVSVPVDPYYLGFWLGDGSKDGTGITSTDTELKAYLQAYVDRLNRSRPEGEPVLALVEHLRYEAGYTADVHDAQGGGSSTITSTIDVYFWRISSSKRGPGFWNPVYTGLRELGFTGEDKTVGIPDCYMNADEDVRLAVLAGLIESDGTRVNKFYRFSQNTYEHEKIVHDAQKLALSCGIQCSPVRQSDVKNRKEPRWEFDMFKGCEKFQHHLILPRKKLDTLNTGSHHVNFDAHTFKVSEPHDGEFRAIEVSGGLYQLANRTIVHNCQWKDALNRLLMTNNFPEFTGRVCPAPCEGACVLGINEDPVGIKSIECAIIDRGFEMGWMVPQPPKVRTGKTVAIIGSGPAGLAAADQLNRAGHLVTVYERADRLGGLLMYGIPNMKLDKRIVKRRTDFMASEGIIFKTGVAVGEEGHPSLNDLRASNSAVVIATGATVARDLPIKGRQLDGIHYAMEFLHKNTKSLLDSELADNTYISAKGKDVVVIGGGDTGNDCIGTSLRHGAKSVTNFELLPQPPPERANDNPWPQWPRIYRVDYGHTEVRQHTGKDPREYCIMSEEFMDDGSGKVKGINTIRVEWTKSPSGGWDMKKVEGSQQFFPADLVLLAMGFLGPEARVLGDEIEKDARKNVKTAPGKYSTNLEGVFAAGDARRGQSLIVWGINEGRQAAREIDLYLEKYTNLPVTGGITKRTAQEIFSQIKVEA